MGLLLWITSLFAASSKQPIVPDRPRSPVSLPADSPCLTRNPEIKVVGHRAMPGERLDARVPLADGCQFVFLDIGGNIGLQARHIFEPRIYPVAPSEGADCGNIAHEFDRWFGTEINQRREDVCVIGFEPNPIHFARLTELAERYTSRGMRTTYLLTAVGKDNATMTFRAPVENAIQPTAAVVGCNDPLGGTKVFFFMLSLCLCAHERASSIRST